MSAEAPRMVPAGDGAALAVWAGGRADGETLLLLHALGCDHRMWAAQVAAAADRYRVLLPDLRGHGASGGPAGAVTLARLGQDGLAVLDAFGVASAHVCGLSLGGVVAQWLAIEAGPRVRRLVLASTASRIGSADSWREREATVRAHGMVAVAAAVPERFFGPAFRGAQPDRVAWFRERVEGADADGYLACCAALREADLTGAVGRIAAPTLVIGGTEDVATPAAQSVALAGAIPGARLLMLAAGHLSAVEQPAAFNAGLLAHLAAEETG